MTGVTEPDVRMYCIVLARMYCVGAVYCVGCFQILAVLLLSTALPHCCPLQPSPCEQVMRRAVKGMLPKNRLRAVRLARLKVFSEHDTPYDRNALIDYRQMRSGP